MATPKRPKDDKSDRFTVDSDKTGPVEVPSISLLLNRKKLGLTKASTPSLASPPRSSTREIANQPPKVSTPPVDARSVHQKASTSAAPGPKKPENLDPLTSIKITQAEEISFELQANDQLSQQPSPAPSLPTKSIIEPSPLAPTEKKAEVSISGIPTLKITPATGRERRSPVRLKLWTTEELSIAHDPLSKSVHLLLSNGVKHAAYLEAVKKNVLETHGKLPEFLCKEAIAPTTQLALWTGLRWDPAVTQDIWTALVQFGFLEFSPPGTMTDIKSNRNVVRAAFGVAKDCWLTIARVGSASSCVGILVLISDESILGKIAQVLPKLGSVPPKAAA